MPALENSARAATLMHVTMKTIALRCRRFGLTWTTLLLLAFAGCMAAPVIPGASPDLLKFLQDGASTREQIMLRLGQPSATYEQEKILTYRVGENKAQGYYLVTPNQLRQWEDVRYSLVLVFDAGGLLQKHSLVAVQ
jgi:hypothetical protein